MSEVITREQMVSAMEAQFHASMTETLGRNWARLNTNVAKQGEGEIDGTIGFHLFELCHGGSMQIDHRGETEDGDDLRNVPLYPGTLQYCPNLDTVTAEMRGTYTVQQIYIDDAVFREVANAIAPGDPDNFKPLGFQSKFDSRLKRIALDILHEARHPSAGGELYADALAQQLAIHILRRRLNGQKEREAFNGKLGPDELANVVEYMEANLEEPGGLDAVAQIAGLDVFSFSRAFKAATGEAPHQFLIQLRMTRAQELLMHSQDSIAEIAYTCGFASQSHMTATFTKRLGVTPVRYRKEKQ
ncbi:MAG: helix-turn-helix domain-containing protein [Pseudomonadota bacterium]